ncbi:MAG TPA: hypothetical protein ENJ17_01375 [Gammaproteobacteria bacterium]|nr:hypothetical protein [Gammaproteobacteria bacterium]
MDRTALIHKGRDNVSDFVLVVDGVPLADASAITRMVLTLDSVVVDSDVESGIDWSGMTVYHGRPAALLRLKLGGVAGLNVGDELEGDLVVYDPDNPAGVVWVRGYPFRVV